MSHLFAFLRHQPILPTPPAHYCPGPISFSSMSFSNSKLLSCKDMQLLAIQFKSWLCLWYFYSNNLNDFYIAANFYFNFFYAVLRFLNCSLSVSHFNVVSSNFVDADFILSVVSANVCLSQLICSSEASEHRLSWLSLRQALDNCLSCCGSVWQVGAQSSSQAFYIFVLREPISSIRPVFYFFKPATVTLISSVFSFSPQISLSSTPCFLVSLATVCFRVLFSSLRESRVVCDYQYFNRKGASFRQVFAKDFN